MRERKFDVEDFMQRVKKFEGTIYEGKVQGEANILYSTGELYKGHLDENFMRTGMGLNLTPGKDANLYYGTFKKNLYQGLGKVFRNDKQFILGYFEEGKLILSFDLDNLDVNIYEQIKNQLSKEMDTADLDILGKIFKDLQEQEGV